MILENKLNIVVDWSKVDKTDYQNLQSYKN